MPEFIKRKNQRGDTVWTIRVFVGFDTDGKKQMINRTVQSASKKDAEAEARRILAERDKGTLITRPCRMSDLFNDLILDHRNNNRDAEWAERIVRLHLNPYFGEMSPSKVTTSLIRAFVDQRRTEGAAPGTVNRALAVLKRAFNLAREETPPRVAQVPYVPMLTEAPPRKGFMEHREYILLRDALPEEIRPVLVFAYHTGCRKGEILKLEWRQVDLLERVVVLDPGETKNDEGRTIPLATELYAMLTMQRQQRDQYWASSPWVFSRCGERIISFDGAWNTACKQTGFWNGEAGRPQKLFHDLRRTGVRNLIRAGVPERVAMTISGHKTRSVFDRYNIVSGHDLKIAAERLSEYLAAKDAENQIPENIPKPDLSGPIQ